MRTCKGSGSGSPSRCVTEGLRRSSAAGSLSQAGSEEAGFMAPRRTRASARSRAERAESLKSSREGSTTAKYKLGLRNCRSELLSRITADGWSSFSAFRSVLESARVFVLANFSRAARMSGRPSARKPCLVRSQKDCCAPAARKRAESVPDRASRSQAKAETCSSGAQSQSWPFCAHTPWPYCVIFPATQLTLGKARMTSQTSCVFPMLRVWPPMTMMRRPAAVTAPA